MAPYLLLGFLIAGLLHVYVPKGAFTRWLGQRNLKSVLYASLIGIPLPLCSCGVIPTGISLYKEGASKGATISFLISTPQTGVDSIMVTYSLLGLPFAIIRPFMALITGLTGGAMMNFFDREEKKEKEIFTEPVSRVQGPKLKRIFNYAFVEFMGDIANWLLIGLLLAGFISLLIPDEFFQTTAFANEWSSMLIILLASVPFYVCATGSVPIAAVLLLKGLNPGAVFVFLMAGPATNIATIAIIARTMGKRTLFIYLFTIMSGALLFGWIINAFFPLYFFTSAVQIGGHHSGSFFFWVEWISVILLTFFMLRIYIFKLKFWNNKRRALEKKSEQLLQVEVEGMSCQNCANRVDAALMELPNVNEVHASFAQNSVVIKGNNMDVEEIKHSVAKAGYKFKRVLSK